MRQPPPGVLSWVKVISKRANGQGVTQPGGPSGQVGDEGSRHRCTPNQAEVVAGFLGIESPLR